MNMWLRLVNARWINPPYSGEQRQFSLQITADTQMYLGQLEYLELIREKLYILFLWTCKFVKSKLHSNLISLGCCISSTEIKIITGSNYSGFSCKFVSKCNRGQGIRLESWQHSFVTAYISRIFINLWLFLAQSLRNWKNLAWDAFKVAEKELLRKEKTWDSRID